jgi:Xaa-Pro dipeptidase
MTKHAGHSIGLTWEAPWIMADDDTVLQEGMVLAVEKGVAHPDVGLACYEDNLIVTSSGAEVITTAPRVWWR